KLWFGQWHHGSTDFPYPNDRFEQWTGALHAWFDRHLQQRDVDTGPPVELFLNDGRVLTEDTWPLPESSPLTLYPSAAETLATSPGAAASASYAADPSALFLQEPGSSIDFESSRVSFVSAPISTDTLIAGAPKLRLSLSMTSPRVDIMGTLWDMAPDGSGEKIGQGAFAMNPELRAGIDNPQPVTPGQTMVLDMEGMAQAHLLLAEHRLALTVASADSDKTPLFAAGARVTLSLGGSDPAALTLPVIENPILWEDPLSPPA
ncbi:MAG: CocE/NonD family hydrolase C-terminal non-catalytic domain-containing protein, partial [Actinomycetota bacterium]